MLSYSKHIAPPFATTSALLIVLFSTIFRGGNRYVPLTLLEWLGVAVFLAWAWAALFNTEGDVGTRLGLGWRRWALMVLVSSPFWIALIQLVPLPTGAGWQALSLLPQATCAAGLAGIPIAALFLSALVCDARALNGLVRAWVVAAVLQGVLGLLQLGGFEPLNFGAPPATGAVGTFANRNHFASFLAMVIPLAMLSVKSPPDARNGSGSVSWPAVAMLFVLMAALFASLSRAGLVIGLAAAAATGWMLWRPAQRANQHGVNWMWALIPLLVILTLAVGGLDWLSRFDVTQLEASARERDINRMAAWAAALDHWPAGSGLGTFASVFPQYQSLEIEQFVEHAHNEYAQWLLELGLLFPVVALIVLLLVGTRLVQWVKSPRNTASTQDRLVLACAMGLLAVSLHAWVDFPLRIPANAMLAAFLLGVFLREPVSRGSNGSSPLRSPSSSSRRPQ